MMENDKQRFCSMIVALADYYEKDITDQKLALYWKGLSSYDIDDIDAAIGKHIQTPEAGRFMPKVSDITLILDGSMKDSSMIAWAKVDLAVRHHGPYVDVVFDDPLIHRVLADMGGWSRLGDKTEDEWPFVGNEFMNRYKGYKTKIELPEHPKILTGIANLENQAHGKALQPAVLIGDSSLCHKVMNNGSTQRLIESREVDIHNEIKKPDIRIVASHFTKKEGSGV